MAKHFQEEVRRSQAKPRRHHRTGTTTRSYKAAGKTE
jgi:hypothetical protein